MQAAAEPEPEAEAEELEAEAEQEEAEQETGEQETGEEETGEEEAELELEEPEAPPAAVIQQPAPGAETGIDTRFDNEMSLIFKFAALRQVPATFILASSTGEFPPVAGDVEFPDFALVLNDLNSYLDFRPLESIFDEARRALERTQSPGTERPTGGEPTAGTEPAGGSRLALLKLGIRDILFAAIQVREANSNDPQFLDTIFPQVVRLFADDRDRMPSEFQSVESFKSAYRNFVDGYQRDLARTIRDKEQIDQIQADLASLPQVPLGEPELSVVTLSISLSIGGRPVTPEDGIDIFALFRTTDDAPYIQYNSVRARQYKVYFPLFSNSNDPAVESLISSVQSFDRPDVIYFFVATSPAGAKIKGYSQQLYWLGRNQMLIRTPIGENIDRQTIVSRIRQSLSDDIEFGVPQEVNFSGKFLIPGIKVDPLILIHFVTVDPLFQHYFFLDESATALSDKSQINIRYKSRPGLEDLEGEKGEGWSLMSFRTSQVPDGTEVHFRQVPTLAVLVKFRDILSRLLSPYSAAVNPNDETSLLSVYRQVVPELYGVVSPEAATATAVQPAKRRAGAPVKIVGAVTNQELHQQIPEVFVTNYGVTCQNKVIPMPVPPEVFQPGEVLPKKIFVRDFEVNIRGQLVRFEGRQILPFPSGDPRYYFFCPSNETPFPGVKKPLPKAPLFAEDSTVSPPRRTGPYPFPFVPCCFKDDQTDPRKKAAKYKQWYEGANPEALGTAGAAGKPILPPASSRKVLEGGKTGQLPKNLNLFLAQVSPDLVRLGIPQGPNSFIHAILTAVSPALDQGYSRIQDKDQRETFVRNLRTSLLTTVRPEVLRQQLYDVTLDELRAQLNNVESYFDPRLYFRALEELFAVNIFLIAADPNDDTSGVFVVPRHKIFFAKTYRAERKTAVVYITTEKTEFPQCDLIVAQPKLIKAPGGLQINVRARLFGLEMTQRLQQGLLITYSTASWNVNDSDIPPGTEMRIDLYSRTNYLDVFPQVKSQILDGYGKLRGLIVTDRPGTAGDQTGALNMTVFLPPAQPENLPDFFLERAPVPLVAADDAVAVLGAPTARSADLSNRTVGLWFRLFDLEYGIYVPVLPGEVLTELAVGPLSPMPLSAVPEVSPIQEYSELKWSSNVFLQLIYWLYSLAQSPAAVSPEEFISEYGEIGPATPFRYELRGIPRLLPDILAEAPGENAVPAALAYLESVQQNLVRNGKIVFPGQATRDRTLKKLKDFDRLFAPLPIKGERWKVPTAIFNYYTEVNDFPGYPNNMLFLTEGSFRHYLTSINRRSGSTPIMKSLSTDMILSSVPVIYLHSDGKVYLIQSFTGSETGTGLELRQAVAAADTWARFKVNTGTTTAPFPLETDDPNFPPYVVYRLAPSSGSILPTADHSGGATPFLQVLFIQPSPEIQRYAALLPLL